MKKSIFFNGLILAGLCFSLALMSCSDSSDDSDSDPDIDYTVAESQLRKDYANYTIGEIDWSTKRGYQIGSFIATPKSQSLPQDITAWYAISGASATREMDSEDLGTAVPASIKVAFEATKYSNAGLWKIEEIELEHNYINGIQSYYEMELQSLTNSNLEAELFFSTSLPTGELLYAKEELDDDDDSDDDRFVINAQLRAAVENAAPGAQIIDAEVDDNLIEVEAFIATPLPIQEIELEFTMNYVLVSKEIETEYLYSTLPAEFGVVKTWFTNNSSNAPTANIKVEITAGDQVENDHTIGNYYYEVEIDDYYSGGTKYEVEFYLNNAHGIIAVIVNDIKIP